MTDRFHTLTVTLEREIRDDDAEALIKAIMQLRGVLDVQGEVADYASPAHMRRSILCSIYERAELTPRCGNAASMRLLRKYAHGGDNSDAFEELALFWPTIYLTVGTDAIFTDGVDITIELCDKPQTPRPRGQEHYLTADCVVSTNGSRRSLAESMVYGQSLRHANELAAWIEAYVAGITAVVLADGEADG